MIATDEQTPLSNTSCDQAVAPIGVFDSGVGGLTVVAALQRMLPHERILYIGDTARVPYGGKSAETVTRYSREISDFLIAERAKLIVVACNTASALAVPTLAPSSSVPLLGVLQPGAVAAVKSTINKKIGVIGTKATIGSSAYEKAIRSLDSDVTVSSVACPLLVSSDIQSRYQYQESVGHKEDYKAAHKITLPDDHRGGHYPLQLVRTLIEFISNFIFLPYLRRRYSNR